MHTQTRFGATRPHNDHHTVWHRPANEPSWLAGAGILASFAVVFGLLAVAWGFA